MSASIDPGGYISSGVTFQDSGHVSVLFDLGEFQGSLRRSALVRN